MKEDLQDSDWTVFEILSSAVANQSPPNFIDTNYANTSRQYNYNSDYTRINSRSGDEEVTAKAFG
ncbi:hypothetical protein JZ785_18920 [Alicyclobacillus curvatus]|nr:hypothetical protein JZ785_18920 [Alicyclobacillus curvatus]